MKLNKIVQLLVVTGIVSVNIIYSNEEVFTNEIVNSNEKLQVERESK